VPDIFLFRFDGARENDEFLNLARSKGHLVYAGLAMQLQRGWIPDFVEVTLDEKAATCTITIVELESTEGSALVSARKYLPEWISWLSEDRHVERRCTSTTTTDR
jgi:hypothetical protein